MICSSPKKSMIQKQKSTVMQIIPTHHTIGSSQFYSKHFQECHRWKLRNLTTHAQKGFMNCEVMKAQRKKYIRTKYKCSMKGMKWAYLRDCTSMPSSMPKFSPEEECRT